MGNVSLSTKNKVLEVLRSQNKPISGEILAQEIGVSRVSIWKAIQSIQNAGYKISSTRNGYYLDTDLADSLYPWEFGDNECLITHFDQTESTMIEARHIAEQEVNLDDNDPRKTQSKIVIADTQTNGQGHNSHKWITTQGSLAFTLITKNRVLDAVSHRVMMVSQITLAKILTSVSGKDFFVRWPNDIWSSKGKVAGILDEYSALGNICKWINLGIGINLVNKPSIIGTDCVFEMTDVVSRKDVLLLFWKEFQRNERLINDTTNELSTLWNSICSDIGKKVRVLSNNREYSFQSINGFGWANLIETGTGEKIISPPGQISFVK